MADPSTATTSAVISTPCAPDDHATHLGREHYSYSFVLQRFSPLLDRWGEWQSVTKARSQLDCCLRRLRGRQRTPFHLAFAPPHAAHLSRHAVNAAFVFWEFPDIPATEAGGDSCNWSGILQRLDRILTACTFTRDAFRRVTDTPVDLVSVPIPDRLFEIPDWQPGQHHRLDVPCHVLPVQVSSKQDDRWIEPPAEVSGTLQGRVRAFYRANVRPYLPTGIIRGVQHSYRAGLRVVGIANEVMLTPLPLSSALELSGVVYLHAANPFDLRKNWRDLLTAYLRALAPREDSTLILKLVTPKELAPLAIRRVYRHYCNLGIEHRCKLVLIPDYLSDAQMQQLIAASTYYVTATHAEGANLPLMDALAAGRPALSPAHTAMGDYHGGEVGWVIPSTPEPVAFPFGPERAATTWQRIDWQSLHDSFRESYEVARQGERYCVLARQARRRMLEHASLESVWPRFAASLDALASLANKRA